MKKLFICLLCILPIFILCGCSLDFSETADEGDFSFAYGNKAAFVTEYRWDGTEAGMTVRIPERYNGLKVVSVGGFFGRGLPMPFSVDISAFFEDGVQWVDPAETEHIDEEIALDFMLILPKQIGPDDVLLAESQWAVQKDGKTIAYTVNIGIEYER